MAEHWTNDPTRNRTYEVPEHFVDRLVAQFPEPRSPRRPDPERWRGYMRKLALSIWAEGYAAGAAHGIAVASAPRYIFCTEEDMANVKAHVEKEL